MEVLDWEYFEEKYSKLHRPSLSYLVHVKQNVHAEKFLASGTQGIGRWRTYG